MAALGQKTANIWVARIIPIILIGIIGYSAYVITKVIAIDYLINPSPDLLVQRRPGSAAAILLFYYLLLIPLLICYARLIQTIITNPGYVPRSAAWYQRRREERADVQRQGRGYHSRRRPTTEITDKPQQSWGAGTQDPESGSSNHSSLAATNKHAVRHASTHDTSTEIPFWERDIFVCNADGRPPFCSTCLSHKPDRTHHCSEIDRCVLKMDHFCPWVGGIVSETSFKYFIQFLVYGAMFCLVILTTMAVFIAERRRTNSRFLDVHYFLILGLSALFLLFTLGMAGSSIQLSLINSSTVENLNRRSKVWFLAVLIPRTADGSLPPLSPSPSTDRPGRVTGSRFQTITYPRPPEEGQFLIHQARGQAQANNNNNNNNNNPPLLPLPTPTTTTTAPSINPPPPRTFAILSTQPGENPFDIGPWRNICQVMGYSISEWLLPIKPSPCADHGSRVSAFPMDEGLVRRLREEVGLGGRGRESDGEGRRRVVGREDGVGEGGAPEDFVGSGRRKRRRRSGRREVAAR